MLKGTCRWGVSLAGWMICALAFAGSANAQAPDGRELLQRAREARIRQDESLGSYEAMARQRISMWIGIGQRTAERLTFRHDIAARIHWQRAGESWVELTGSREHSGAWRGSFSTRTDANLASSVPIPYFPGRDQLWTGDGIVMDFIGKPEAVKDSVDIRAIIHPLANGAERFYDYTTGDSATFTLPSGQTFLLRELRVVPKRPDWNVIVGSFWFDNANANLVRAVYRTAVAIDMVDATRDRKGDKVPSVMRGLVAPFQVELPFVVIECGLVNERFWLPRVQTLEAVARASSARMSFRIEQRFDYSRVNAQASPPDTAETTDAKRVRVTRYRGAPAILTLVPSDRKALAVSRDFTSDLVADDDSLFDAAAQRTLANALDMGLQAKWSPRGPVFAYGFPMTRFNRVEGLSTGIGAAATLGGGYSARAELRGGFADHRFGAELGLSRTDLRTSIGVGAYKRVSVMNDWGAPLTFSASLLSLMFGRDEGAYYRTTGGELTGAHTFRGSLTWRAFGERQRAARVETDWSLFGPKDGDRTISNPQANDANAFGLAVRHAGLAGRNMDGWQLANDVRLEGAIGTFRYVRVLAEAAIMRRIGPARASLEGGVGVSGGSLPAQRAFYVGGKHSIRGQLPLTSNGNAMWRARAEVRGRNPKMAPAAFADLGWAGRSDAWRDGHPGSGCGLGAVGLDGLVRIDIARGLRPQERWRLEATLGARF